MAQRHPADLEEKRRKIEQMMDGLSELVQACHGNDRPIAPSWKNSHEAA